MYLFKELRYKGKSISFYIFINQLRVQSPGEAISYSYKLSLFTMQLVANRGEISLMRFYILLRGLLQVLIMLIYYIKKYKAIYYKLEVEAYLENSNLTYKENIKAKKDLS